MIDFKDQVVVVTGAGRGLGRLYAMEFARHGAAVVVNDVGSTMHGEGQDADVAEEVVAAIKRGGGVAVASYDSVASPEGGEAIVNQAVKTFGRLDAVVSNAGIFETTPFEAIRPQDWRRMLGVHLDESFYVSQPAFKVMKAQNYGRFVFVSSSAGMFGMTNEAHYAAAKAGIFGLKNVIAIEGAAHGILANAILPTGFSRMVTETVGGEEVAAQSPFLRSIKPELVVPLVIFLASRDCPVTHHNYAAIAGRYSRAFVGYGKGWLAEGAPTADDIAARWAEVSATQPFTVPSSIIDEVVEICALRGIGA